MFAKKKLYKYWDEIVKLIDFDISGKNLSYYSFRHYGITERLSAENTSIWDIAKMAGTMKFEIKLSGF